MHRSRLLAAGTALAAAASLTACSADSGSDTAPGSTSGRTDVVVSFYPLAYLAEQIGGEHVKVTDLTPPGKEPHELELTPQQVATASTADLGIYEKGIQPDVDKAFADNAPKSLLDVSSAADLSLRFSPAAVGTDEEGTTGAVDPHFWLDPVRYAKVADAVQERLASVDPAHKDAYAANAAALKKQLTALDGELKAGLATCADKNVVTSHAAFGYLTKRYGLNQVAIAGLSPEQEPEPAQMAQIAAFAKKNKVSTIYTETLASPAIAKTVAAETGATTAVLDPIEGITDASAARDYPGVMRANLAALKKGQSCR